MTRRILTLRALAATGLLTLGLGAASSGCLNRPIDRLEPRTTSTVVERLTQSAVDKIDLLLAIDNSISMADKQQILAEAVPDLVERLVKPICVNLETGDPAEPPLSVDAAGECPTGLKPEFPPIKDINIGIISSSLGALTAQNCTDLSKGQDDKGHLLSRLIAGGNAETYQGKGFLAWDPDSKRVPPGTTTSEALIPTLRDMVIGVGQTGCGYEMQLESVYRFLADPDPYESLTAGADGRLVENGTDQVLLTQRADFLRANSLLAILILSDENDCSVDVSGQGYLVLGQAPFYRATEECAGNPNDPCCTSCALGNPDGCAADASCGAQGTSDATRYAASDDHGNLRCFEQKRRYGVNFLYPVQRYVNAFSLPNIDPTRRDLEPSDPKKAVKNPIFQDLSGQGVAVRDPGLVFVAGIVGIPWQYLARGCKQGEECPGAPPDLNYGFKSFNELAEAQSTTGNKLLDALIGDPDNNTIPEDPFMRESIAKRQGNSVVPGLEGQSLPGTNALNGNDRNVEISDSLNADLQYSCIFQLDTPDPAGPDCTACAMNAAMCDEPLCDPANKATQVNAKAYPGLRELALLRGMQNQGIFASICPQQTDTPDAANYGYRPAVGAIIDRLKQELGGQCLPRKLNVNPNTGQVPCLVLEATVTDNCNCDESIGRRNVAPENQNAVKAAQQDEFAPEPDGWNCFCEIVQFACTQDSEGKCVEDTNSDQYVCQNVEAVPTDINGWCYVDATPPGPVGNPALVADCAEDEKRLVRFVNKGLPQPGATVFVTCTGDSVEE